MEAPHEATRHTRTAGRECRRDRRVQSHRVFYEFPYIGT
jgi:hypothetical protein